MVEIRLGEISFDASNRTYERYLSRSDFFTCENFTVAFANVNHCIFREIATSFHVHTYTYYIIHTLHHIRRSCRRRGNDTFTILFTPALAPFNLNPLFIFSDGNSRESTFNIQPGFISRDGDVCYNRNRPLHRTSCEHLGPYGDISTWREGWTTYGSRTPADVSVRIVLPCGVHLTPSPKPHIYRLVNVRIHFRRFNKPYESDQNVTRHCFDGIFGETTVDIYYFQCGLGGLLYFVPAVYNQRLISHLRVCKMLKWSQSKTLTWSLFTTDQYRHLKTVIILNFSQ